MNKIRVKIAYLGLVILAILALITLASPAEAYDEGFSRPYAPPPTNYNPNYYNYNYNPNPPQSVPPLNTYYQTYQPAPAQNPTVVYRTVYVPAGSTNSTDTTETTNNDGNGDDQDKNKDDEEKVEEKYGGLAASALFGGKTFKPSGLAQWVFLAILVLIIIILVRRVFGATKDYHETPLKHA